MMFHNGPDYDFHFKIKELAEELKSNFQCLGKNTKDSITFSVPIKKETENDKTIA